MNKDNYCPHCKQTDCNGYSCQQEERKDEKDLGRCQNCYCRLWKDNVSVTGDKCKECYDREKKRKEKQAQEETKKEENQSPLNTQEQPTPTNNTSDQPNSQEKEQNNNPSDNSSSKHHCQTCHKELTELESKLGNVCETCENNKKRKFKN